MTGSRVGAADVNLSDPCFWELTRRQRFAAFAALREERPVSWQPPPITWAPRNGTEPGGYYAVTRYDDVRAVHRDTATFRSGEGVMLYDNLPLDIQYRYDGWISLDAPQHTALRRHIARAFTPRVMRRLEASIKERAAECISKVAASGECDFYRDIVAPLPATVMHDLLGVPEDARPRVSRLVHEAVRFGSASSFDECLESALQVWGFAQELAEERRRLPADDLLTAIVQEGPDGTRLSDEDVVVTFWLVLTGGSDTMALAAAHGMAALGEHPDQRLAWRDNYEKMAEMAIEEILRWSAPVISMRRNVAVDTEIAGQAISAGENVLVIYPSANRDDTVFADPERFDITRSPNPHVSFGSSGPHFCLGAHLARLELKVFFRELFERLPDLDVTGELVYVADPFIDDISSLPCRFTPTDLPVRQERDDTRRQR